MKFTAFLQILFVTVSSALVSGAHLENGVSVKRGGASSASISHSDMKISMHFEGTIAGHTVNMTGTIEEILTHVETKHPEFKREHLLTAAKNDTAVAKRNLEERDYKTSRFCCPVPGQNFWWATQFLILDGIHYLNHFNGLCSAGPGPGNCVRISCSWYSGIWLCNDNPYTIYQPCNWISTFASDLVKDCSKFRGEVMSTCGQEFSNAGYNVYVSRANC